MVALLSLWGIRDFYNDTEDYVLPRDPYGVALQQTRLQSAISSLPAVRMVGYFKEPSPDDSFPGGFRRLGAQYAVAPRALVLQDQSPQEWVIGDFSQPMDFARFAQARGLHVVKVLADGIVLFQRNGAP